MKSFPKISIVIPSYNKAKYIKETLDSIVAQNYPNLEVLIQDGGSSDGTLQILKKYSGKHPKIFRYETGRDKGQLDAINKGLKRSTGEILTFINADDVYEQGAFKKVQSSALKNPGALWFAGRGKVIDAGGAEIAKLATLYKGLLLFLNSRFNLLAINYLMQPSVFLTRKAYNKYGPFTGTSDFVMEYDLWLKISKIQMPFVIPETLSSFRLEPSSKTERLYKKLLAEDGKIVKKYSSNIFILSLHAVNNWFRAILGKALF